MADWKELVIQMTDWPLQGPNRRREWLTSKWVIFGHFRVPPDMFLRSTNQEEVLGIDQIPWKYVKTVPQYGDRRVYIRLTTECTTASHTVPTASRACAD